MEATIYVATSLDGYIARPNGGLDWLPEPSSDDADFCAFLESIDCLVMGRNTYDKVLSFGFWPYGKKPVKVLTHRGLEPPSDEDADVRAISGEPTEVAEALRAQGFGKLYVDGGVTVQSFLRRGLITRVIITRIPILIGSGIPLFGEVEQDISLRHVETKILPGGLEQSEYRVAVEP